MFAQTENTIQLDARDLQASADVYLSPRNASFIEGSTFEVPILIDTKGSSINSVEIEVRYDPQKLSVVNPSGGKSIIGIWIEPPHFDNSNGIVRLVGTIPGGITAHEGLVATMTFRARSTGGTSLRVSSDSQVLLNDGYGTAVETTFGRADYTIVGKPPEGVAIFSETHPLTDRWYNNNNPVLAWEGTAGDAYSYVLDSSPHTVPDNTMTATDSRVSFADVKDGVWFFHLKSKKNGIWGATTHFELKIDTTPPAEFSPSVDYLLAAAAYRGLVSFKTTDTLSGIDHYEVGVLDRAEDTASPVFIQSESPFQVPSESMQMRVFVRAFDKAGNIRDASVDVNMHSFIALLIRNAWTVALAALLVLVLALVGTHYLVRHHIFRHLRDAYGLFRREQQEEVLHDSTSNGESHVIPPPPPEDSGPTTGR